MEQSAATYPSPRQWSQPCCQMSRRGAVARKVSNRHHAQLPSGRCNAWGIVHSLLHPTPVRHGRKPKSQINPDCSNMKNRNEKQNKNFVKIWNISLFCAWENRSVTQTTKSGGPLIFISTRLQMWMKGLCKLLITVFKLEAKGLLFGSCHGRFLDPKILYLRYASLTLHTVQNY